MPHPGTLALVPVMLRSAAQLARQSLLRPEQFRDKLISEGVPGTTPCIAQLMEASRSRPTAPPTRAVLLPVS
jgi:hypothetical protein